MKGLAEGEGWDLELPLDRRDGRRIWVRVMGKPTLADGRPIRITGALQDVTDQRNARLALQRASERAVLATDSGGIGIWDWDIETGGVIWDASMYRLRGMEPQDGRASYDLWLSCLHPDDRDAAEQALRDAVAGPEFRITTARAPQSHWTRSRGRPRRRRRDGSFTENQHLKRRPRRAILAP